MAACAERHIAFFTVLEMMTALKGMEDEWLG